MTRGGRKPQEDEEDRICEASLMVRLHLNVGRDLIFFTSKTVPDNRW